MLLPLLQYYIYPDQLWNGHQPIQTGLVHTCPGYVSSR